MREFQGHSRYSREDANERSWLNRNEDSTILAQQTTVRTRNRRFPLGLPPELQSREKLGGRKRRCHSFLEKKTKKIFQLSLNFKNRSKINLRNQNTRVGLASTLGRTKRLLVKGATLRQPIPRSNRRRRRLPNPTHQPPAMHGASVYL